MKWFRVALWVFVVPAAAMAVSTSHWKQAGEDDFKSGTLRNVVATNLGDLKLSRAVKTLLEEDPKVSMVTALAQAKSGVIYAGTAPQGELLQISGDKVTPVTTIADAVSITSLVAEDDGGLLIGVSGASGRVLKIDKPGGKPHEIFSEKDVQYVWGLVELPDGMVYAATGPGGQLFSISPDGSHAQIYKSDETNLTALATDGKDNLYLGTDPDGLVVRINRKTKDSYVMYNTEEQEVTALALDGKGNIYAATGQILPQQQPGQPEQPAKETQGHPESPAGNPLPSQKPTPPKPPAPAPPPPGQPAPIPQKPTAWNGTARVIPIMLLSDEDDSGAPDQGPTVPGIPAAAPDAGAADQDKAKEAGKGGEAEQQKAQGNAIYQIDANGFVTEIFREQVIVYSMLATNGRLLVGTGNDGEIFQVDPAAGETVVIAKTDAKQVTSLLAGADGRIYLGLANTGAIAAMSNGYADSGTFTSAVLDATQVSRFGVIQMHGSLPVRTSLTVSTRSGNLKDPDASGWGPWTAPAPALEFMHITSPPARFMQYRITFGSNDPGQTPLIHDVDVAYQMPHLAPAVKSIKIADAQKGDQPTPPDKPAAKPQGTGTQAITWETTDADGDTLVYSLYFRTAPGGQWILLKDKLTDTTFNWDTKGVADGRYEVKVTASDALANAAGDGKTASRVSDVLVVDNTPPVIGDIRVTMTGRSAHLDLRVTDQTSTVASLEYSVDSSDNWQSVFPVDKIFDEPDEKVSMTVGDLAVGAHQITLRATDSRGNVALQTVAVTAAEK